MLLAIDAGNTNIVLGVFDAGSGFTPRCDWRIATHHYRTEDEYLLLIHSLLAMRGIAPSALEGAIISSVVPQLDRTLQNAAQRLCGREPLMVGHATDTGIRIGYRPPEEVGSDRIVNAAAAWHRWGEAAVIVDFGTATTFDALSAEGVYLGGAIAPGIGISVDALAQHAARLRRVELLAPDAAIGRTTEAAMRSGIVFGYAGMADAMVRRFTRELGGAARAIATGGLASLVAREMETEPDIDPGLTLSGLRIIWDRNRP